VPESRTSIFARRQQLGQLPSRQFQWPAHLVTAPHAVTQRPGDEHPRMPHGEWHARETGSLQTACGRSAVTWPIFWTLEFSTAGGRACPECLREVGRTLEDVRAGSQHLPKQGR
jgi:hypothetical protein